LQPIDAGGGDDDGGAHGRFARRTRDGWPQNKLRSIGITYDVFATHITTVSPKFQVVIPKRVREQFGLSPGQTLQVIALPGRIELVPTQSPAALPGFLPGKNTFQRELVAAEICT